MTADAQKLALPNASQLRVKLPPAKIPEAVVVNRARNQNINFQ
jgi:hypothetical protein